MKLKLILFAISISMQSSCAQSKDETLINDFLNEIVIPLNIKEVATYLTVKEGFKNNNDYNLFIKSAIDLLKSELDNKNCNDYKIISFKDSKKIGFVNLERYLQEYQKYENTFFIVCDTVIVIPFILKEHKIVSFSTTLIKNKKSNYHPMFLDR
jgi:hypothetical protein